MKRDRCLVAACIGVVAVLFLSARMNSAIACSLLPPGEPFEPQPLLTAQNETAPPAPDVKIEEISRGKLGSSSCDDLGFIELSIPATEASKAVAYDFSQVSGAPLGDVFGGPYIGREEHGKLTFVFAWIDERSAKQEPIDIILRVTAIGRSGVKGGFTDLHLVSPGR